MLTAKQARLLEFLTDHQRQSPVSPSFEETREHLGLASKCGVHHLVARLEERGFIRRLRHRARSIEVIQTVPSSACPHCGGTGRRAED